MQKIRFAIIGCGQIAQRHATHAQNYGELTAVCDTVPQRADALAEMHAARAYYAIEELLTKETTVDVIVICTPNGLHAKHTIQSLSAGFHVLVEKPMAIKVADCIAMMDAARKAGKKIFTVKQNRFNPPVLALKKAIEKGDLGKIYSVQLSCFWNRPADYYMNTWHGSKELDGGVLFTQFSHFIDLLYWLFGDVKTIQSITKNFAHIGLVEGEDSGVIVFELFSGAIGTINYSVNSFQKNAEGSLTVIAEKGTVKIGGEYLNTIAYQQMENTVLVHEGANHPANLYGNYQGSMSNHAKVYADLVAALQQGAAYYATAFEAMKTVEIIERIYQSAKN